MANANIPFQVDIGFGDAVKINIELALILTFLPELPQPHLKTYPVYSVIAEKFHAMVELGLLNSKLKDFYDYIS